MRSAALAAALVGILLSAAPATGETHGLPLPPGTRAADDDSTFRSSRGFRATVQFYSRHLERRGIPHREVPVYRHRGVNVARFLATRERRPWAAIHVYRHRGTTYIAIVSSPPLDPSG